MSIKSFLRHCLYVLLVVAITSWHQPTRAQQQGLPEARIAQGKKIESGGNEFTLRTYEVGALILNIHDHPYSESLQLKSRVGGGGGFGGGGGGGGVFSVPEEIGTHSSAKQKFFSASLASVQEKRIPTQLCQFGGGGGGGGGRGGGAVLSLDNSSAAANVSISDLIRVITTTVDSKNWQINGTGMGEIESLGTTLVVWQTRAVHEHISELLKQLGQSSTDRRTLTIDARWLLLNSDELDRLLQGEQKGVPQADPKILAEFTRRPGSIRGITNCFSSQLVYLVSGTRQNVVSSYIPVVGSIETPQNEERLAARQSESFMRLVSDNGDSGDRSVGYQPIVEKPNLGALLELRPTAIPGESDVVVDLKSTITVLAERPAGPAVKQGFGAMAPEVDRIAIETQEFATSLRIPLAQPVLVGGMTYVPTSMEARQGTSEDSEERTAAVSMENPQLYLVLEVR